MTYDAAAERQKERRFAIKMFCGMAAAFAVFVGIIAWAASHADERYDRFMNGCAQDHKEYECVIMWRASRRDDGPPSVVFVPTPTIGR